MIETLAVITGLVLVGTLVFCTLLSLGRHGKSVVIGTEGRTMPAQLTPPVALPEPLPVVPAVVVEPEVPQVFSGLDKARAEELLDWLERNGRVNCKLSYDKATGFTVRCP